MHLFQFTSVRENILIVIICLIGICAGCSASERRVMQSRVRIIKSQDVPPTQKPGMAAQVNAAAIQAVDIIDQTGRYALVFVEMHAAEPPVHKNTVQQIQSLFEGDLIGLSGNRRFQVFSKMENESDSIAGTPVHDPDIKIEGTVFEETAAYRLQLKLINVQTGEILGAFMHPIRKPDQTQYSEFVPTKNIVQDIQSGLYWERVIRANDYGFQSA